MAAIVDRSRRAGCLVCIGSSLGSHKRLDPDLIGCAIGARCVQVLVKYDCDEDRTTAARSNSRHTPCVSHRQRIATVGEVPRVNRVQEVGG